MALPLVPLAVIGGIQLAGGIAAAATTQNKKKTKVRQIYRGEIDPYQQAASASRGDQAQLGNLLRQSAIGQGPSAAEKTQLIQNQAARNQSASLAASARGGNIALAQRGAQMGQADAISKIAGETAAAKQAEMAQAQGQLGSVLAQQREGDLGQANIESTLAQANLAALEKRDQMEADRKRANKDRAAGAITGGVQALDKIKSDIQSKENVSNDFEIGKSYFDVFNKKDEPAPYNPYAPPPPPEEPGLFERLIDKARGGDVGAAKRQMRREGREYSQARQAEGANSAAMQGGQEKYGMKPGQQLLVSDKQDKEDVEETLDAIKPYKYNYTPESAAYQAIKKAENNPDMSMAELLSIYRSYNDKERAGVMAQDMEKGGKIGKDIVAETSTGKALKMEESLSFLLASVADLNDRLKQMEK